MDQLPDYFQQKLNQLTSSISSAILLFISVISSDEEG